jgi:hypothetical protein
VHRTETRHGAQNRDKTAWGHPSYMGPPGRRAIGGSTPRDNAPRIWGHLAARVQQAYGPTGPTSIYCPLRTYPPTPPFFNVFIRPPLSCPVLYGYRWYRGTGSPTPRVTCPPFHPLPHPGLPSPRDSRFSAFPHSPLVTPICYQTQAPPPSESGPTPFVLRPGINSSSHAFSMTNTNPQGPINPPLIRSVVPPCAIWVYTRAIDRGVHMGPPGLPESVLGSSCQLIAYWSHRSP